MKHSLFIRITDKDDKIEFSKEIDLGGVPAGKELSEEYNKHILALPDANLGPNSVHIWKHIMPENDAEMKAAGVMEAIKKAHYETPVSETKQG